MLFSGELSMTSVLPEPGVVVPEVEELEAPPLAPVDELLEEQAASPAARRPTAAIATALLVGIGLIVNFDCPLGRYCARADFFSFLGDAFYFWGIA
jgi:hypothetical protein